MSQSEFDAEQARRDLYEVMKRDQPFQEKATAALDLGRRYLDVANGHLTDIDQPTDYRKVVASTDPPDGPLPPGLVIDLELTFCRETIAADDPVKIHDAAEQGYEDHPAYDLFGISCYHGTTISIDGEPYGTVCFGSLGARSEPFSDDETLFAELIGRMLEHEINRQRTQAEIERLDRFASVVSHDLRNPMTVARSRIELEQREHDSEHLDAVATAIDRMDDLIDDVLAVARQGREVQEIQTVSLQSLVGCCTDTVAVDDGAVTVADDFEFRADRDRVQQLLENLFRNALEHGVESGDPNAPDRTNGHRGDVVSITVGPLDSGQGFYVEDDGRGIPEADREEIFESGFTTADEGTGLGLSIVESIVEAHDWTIEVTDGQEGGARFEVSDVVARP